MPHQNTVFRQLTNLLPWGVLERAIERYRADKGVRRLPTCEMLLALLFAHAAEATSLRDIEAALEARDAQHYHSRLPTARRSTLADALATRPVEVFTAVLSTLIAQLTGKLRRSLGDCIRLIDSTPIRLNSLSAHWARFSRTVFGAKAHIIHDPDADCPLYLVVTPANVNDITVAKTMPIDAGATYVFDLGYYDYARWDYAWWAVLCEAACRIVTRLKSNTPLLVIETRRVPGDAPDILSDRVGFLPERMANSRRNPIYHAMREIRVKTETGKILRSVSNDLDPPASQIAGAMLSRKRLDRFAPRGGPPAPPPAQNKAQGTLLWA